MRELVRLDSTEAKLEIFNSNSTVLIVQFLSRPIFKNILIASASLGNYVASFRNGEAISMTTKRKKKKTVTY